MKTRNLACLLIAAATLAGADTALASESVKISIDKFVYTPAHLEIKKGDTVEWTNNDFVDHTVTSLDKKHEIIIKAHSTNTMVMSEAGQYAYFCRFHPNMKADLTVK